MSLTQEQILEARRKFGIPEEGLSASANSPAANVARRRKMAAEYDAKLEREKGFLTRAKEAIGERASQVGQTFGEAFRGEISPIETGVRTVGDVIGGAGDVLGAAVDPLVRPVIEKVAETKLGKQAFDKIGEGVEAFNEWKEQSDANRRIGEFLEGAGNIASIAPISAGAKAGQIATKQVGKAAVNGGKLAMKGVKPAALPTKNASEFAIAQLTGMTPDTISTLVRNPKLFTKAQAEGLRRITLAEKVKTALDKRIDDLSGLGKEYEPIKNLSEVVQLPEGGYKRFIEDEFNVRVLEGNKIQRTPGSVPMSKQDVSAIEEFLDVFGDSANLAADEFLNARHMLDNIARFDQGKTGASRTVSRKLRQFHDRLGKEQLEGLAELDAKFAPEAQKISSLRKELLDKDGNLKDAAINRIANLTGKGKDLQLRRLQQLMPDIEEQVKILRAIEDIEYASGRTVGAYMRGGIGTVGVVTGNIPFVVGAIAATPKLIVPILLKWGKSGAPETMVKIIKKIQNGIKLNNTERSVVKNAFEAAGASLGAAITAGAIEGLQKEIDR